MKKIAENIWCDDRGVLSFEWTLLVTLVTLGLVSGLSAARDGFISELADIAGAIVAVDQSFTGFGEGFEDDPVEVTTCERADDDEDDDPPGP